MTVKRIVTNIATPNIAEVRAFYADLFDLKLAMDHGWITTLAAGTKAPVQLSIASEGGSGTPVPALTIEVEDVDVVHKRACELGHDISYPLTDEPWGMRRFYLRDPAGTLINVAAHIA